MRHRVKGRKLGRTKPHRAATLRALSSALIKEHRIETTLPKAKELRTFIEPLITIAKVDNTHNRRKVFSALQDKHAVTELFGVVGPAVADRPGGYTRVLKLGFRFGDSADMAVIELVDFNDEQPEQKTARKRRTRRAGKSSAKPAASSNVDNDENEQSEVVADATSEPVKADAAETSASEKESAADSATEEKTTSEDTKDDADIVSEDDSAANEADEEENVPSESDKKSDEPK